MPRITKKLREQAAMICQVAASNRLVSVGEAAHWIGFDWRAYMLAVKAWGRTTPSLRMAEDFAEAESMLRTGWTPEIWEGEP